MGIRIDAPRKVCDKATSTIKTNRFMVNKYNELIFDSHPNYTFDRFDFISGKIDGVEGNFLFSSQLS
jgi:hypothetical protein